MDRSEVLVVQEDGIARYGKSLKDIFSYKKTLVEDNYKLLEEQNRFADIYKKQPKRTKCKCCKASLDKGKRFFSHDVEYAVCCVCGHVNGLHEETEEFCQYMYMDSGLNESVYKNSEKREEEVKLYEQRVADVYLPKAKFMLECLQRFEMSSNEIKNLDIGTGMGYFCSALDDLGIEAVGVDMGKNLLEYGSQFLHTNNGARLETINGNSLEEVVRNTEANVISAIGVLEHLSDFHDVFKAIKINKNIKFLFMSVPTFGLANILEVISPNIYNRHLGGGHTHVFSASSIKYLCNLYNMEIVGKWSFGADIMDLYRICIVNCKQDISNIINEKFMQVMDELQLVLDKNEFCSEIHLMLKVN